MFDDADEENSEGESSESDSDDEEVKFDEKSVQRELERIKQEKAVPPAAASSTLQRRWDDDVVFRNNAPKDMLPKEKRFINDTVRSDKHKEFLKKYIR